MTRTVIYGWIRTKNGAYETGDSDWDGKWYTNDIDKAHLFDSGDLYVRRITYTYTRDQHSIMSIPYAGKWGAKCMYCERHQSGKLKALESTAIENIKRYPCVVVTIFTYVVKCR